MAAVPVVIDGVLYPKNKKDAPIVGTFIGNSFTPGLSVGYPLPTPEPPVSPGGPPPVISFPIWGPPGTDFPGTPGYPPVAGHPLPIPPAPGPDLDPAWKKLVAWTPTTGWIVVLVPGEDTLVPTPSRK